MRAYTFMRRGGRVLRIVGFGVLVVVAGALTAFAATNISSNPVEHWAWNDLIGWINFYESDTVVVSSGQLAGYATSAAGDISLDCATTRIGDVCTQSDYKVTNDGGGNLSGWGWSDAYGWVSFDCANHGGCGVSNYRVRIDPIVGEFSDYAWNDVVGWISFNCSDVGACGTSDYKVVTSWRATSTSGFVESSTFDTGVVGGAQLNSLLWHGVQPADTFVNFQFATSNTSTGPWTFVGPDGTGNTQYAVGPDVSLPLDYTLHNNQRYFRYRVTLISDGAQSASPRVDEVVINWSP